MEMVKINNYGHMNLLRCLKKKSLVLIGLILMVTMLASCLRYPTAQTIQTSAEPTEQATPETTEQTAPEPSAQAMPESTEQAAPEPSVTPEAAMDISHIPYFGDREKFRLPAEHALAYAEAVMSAELSWGSTHVAFDRFRPVLIDVSGDGVPLLLLVEKDHSSLEGLILAWNILFGYADGELQRISNLLEGIGIKPLEDENLIGLLVETDFGGYYHWHRVQNGAAELVSVTTFESNWHAEGGATFFIDGVQFGSQAEYMAELAKIPLEYLLGPSHPGFVFVVPEFRNYLSRSFSREEVAQMFLDYAASLGYCESA